MTTAADPCFVVYITSAHGSRYLLWQEGVDGDHFLLDRRSKLLSASTTLRLRTEAAKQGLKVSNAPVVRFNLEALWRALQALIGGQRTTRPRCRTILNGWNFIEDLSRSVGLREHAVALGGLYESLLIGADPLEKLDASALDEIRISATDARKMSKYLVSLWSRIAVRVSQSERAK